MFSIEQVKNEFIVSLFNSKRLNILIAEKVKNQLMQFLSLPNSIVTLNMSGIDFVDSASFEMLKDLNEQAKVHNCKFRLMNVNQDVLELIHLVEMEKVLVIH